MGCVAIPSSAAYSVMPLFLIFDQRSCLHLVTVVAYTESYRLYALLLIVMAFCSCLTASVCFCSLLSRKARPLMMDDQ